MFNWFRNLFKKKPETRLGIDLGSSVIKLVEISSQEDKLKLETYGLAHLTNEYLENLSNKEISQIIKELIKQAQVKTNIAYFSLPVFATFSTLIDLPFMSEEELASAIPYEARKYIPVPLEEVALDWSIIAEPRGTDQPRNYAEDIHKDSRVQVILVAILKEVIEKYTKIAQIANLEIKALEAESFSLARSLVGQDKSSNVLIDIGSRFTDITLVKNGSVRVIHNAKKVIDPAGQLNKESLVQEVERVLNLYRTKYNHLEKIKCILTGRSALVPSLVDYLKERFNFEVLIGNPFSKIKYLRVLEPVLKEIGPSLSVAVGLAMRE